jgi:hypothetical protein
MPEDGAISLVVSNPLQIEPDAVGLVVIVEERKGRGFSLAHLLGAHQAFARAWHVVEFDRAG